MLDEFEALIVASSIIGTVSVPPELDVEEEEELELLLDDELDEELELLEEEPDEDSLNANSASCTEFAVEGLATLRIFSR